MFWVNVNAGSAVDKGKEEQLGCGLELPLSRGQIDLCWLVALGPPGASQLEGSPVELLELQPQTLVQASSRRGLLGAHPGAGAGSGQHWHRGFTLASPSSVSQLRPPLDSCALPTPLRCCSCWLDSSAWGPLAWESSLGLRGCLDLGRYVALERDIPPFSWLPSSTISRAQHPPVSGPAWPRSTLCVLPSAYVRCAPAFWTQCFFRAGSLPVSSSIPGDTWLTWTQ